MMRPVKLMSDRTGLMRRRNFRRIADYSKVLREVAYDAFGADQFAWLTIIWIAQPLVENSAGLCKNGNP
jgi:hypothetical protein